jgi:hypothetical protein
VRLRQERGRARPRGRIITSTPASGVRQLFEAPLVAASPPERAEFLAGAAGHAARLFGLTVAQEDAAGALLDPSLAILHGLYWLSANLGRRSPLLLCADDIHWADQASLRFLHCCPPPGPRPPMALRA